MSEEHPHPTQNREWLASISTPETRRRGMLAMLHDQNKNHDAAGCPRCEEETLTTSLSVSPILR